MEIWVGDLSIPRSNWLIGMSESENVLNDLEEKNGICFTMVALPDWTIEFIFFFFSFTTCRKKNLIFRGEKNFTQLFSLNPQRDLRSRHRMKQTPKSHLFLEKREK